MKRILVIEDDPDIGEMLGSNLRDEGYAVEIANEGAAGLARLKTGRYDLLILDLMLPGIDGLEIRREVRRMPHYHPIVIISAKSTETQRVLGLELGADDYLTRPFSVPELVARIRALFRRVEAMQRESQAKAGVIVRGPLTIDPVGYEHTVNSHINRLRAKIERDPARPEFIRRLDALTRTIAAFDEASFAGNLKVDGALQNSPDEVGRLAASFSHMAERSIERGRPRSGLHVQPARAGLPNRWWARHFR
ncbi:response regulator [Methylococcus capsulatus]|uniref:response regulator n=1 Tax=Methylococcus capsulatus TaxID=414 RepID=UPI001C5302D2|nr:response regulator [Methylococcus capsulatus]QXP87436.1 response regulator [Methylococcus capsulatus]UQN12441.1 response regulator [Methylococcus capsulatus]